MDFLNLNALFIGKSFLEQGNDYYWNGELWNVESFSNRNFSIIIDCFDDFHKQSQKKILTQTRRIRRANQEKRKECHAEINKVFEFLNSLKTTKSSVVGLSEICLTTTVRKVKNLEEYSDYDFLICRELDKVFWEVLFSIFKLDSFFDGNINKIFEAFFNIENEYPCFDKERALAFFEEIDSYFNGKKLSNYVKSYNPMIKMDVFNHNDVSIKVQVEKIDGFFDEQFYGLDRDFFLCIALTSIFLEKRKNKLNNARFFEKKKSLTLKGVEYRQKLSLDFGEHIVFSVSNPTMSKMFL